MISFRISSPSEVGRDSDRPVLRKSSLRPPSRLDRAPTPLELKQAGVRLAAAVLIEATLIRGVLLPAMMKLLGDRNWYLPGRLRWLPQRNEPVA
jgi:hypothetical protein